MFSIRQRWRDTVAVLRLPLVSVDLMCAAATGNDPFYQRLVREFYRATQKRHPKLPVIRRLEYGVALCPLPGDFDAYFMAIESSARRNFKKCCRSGYEFRRINFNDFLGNVSEILRSTDVRQGAVPQEFLQGEVRPAADPPSLTNVHDYAYFGILREGKLVAYAGCLVCGEIFVIEQIYGHAGHQQDGVVPMLIISMAQYIPEHYPNVKYYAYGTFYGAGRTLRRFKKKFKFMPHRVKWVLG